MLDSVGKKKEGDVSVGGATSLFGGLLNNLDPDEPMSATMRSRKSRKSKNSEHEKNGESSEAGSEKKSKRSAK